jgi:hypothetical protein
MKGGWWRVPLATFGMWSAFLPPGPADSILGLSDHPLGLAAIKAVLMVSSVVILLQGWSPNREDEP